MGAWGFSVMHDDDAADAHAAVMKLFNAGKSRKDVLATIEKQYKSDFKDPDCGPPTLFGIAKAIWDCGWMDAAMIKRVRKEIDSGRGLERWEDEGPKVVSKRKAQLGQFLAQLERTNPKPKKPKAPTQRVAAFRKGDCVSFRLDDGRYAALVVLNEELVDPKRSRETYGKNLVGVLDWIGATPPTMDVFEKRAWLKLTHHSWNKEQVTFHASNTVKRRYPGRAHVVGTTTIRASDPTDSPSYADWSFAEQVVMQEQWDKDKARPKSGR